MLKVSILQMILCQEKPKWLTKLTPERITALLGECRVNHSQTRYLDSPVLFEHLEYGIIHIDRYDGILDVIYIKFTEKFDNKIGKVQITDYEQFYQITLGDFASFLFNHQVKYDTGLFFTDHGLITLYVHSNLNRISFDFNFYDGLWILVNCNFSVDLPS